MIDKLSYALGMVIGHNLRQMGITEIHGTDFADAVSDVLSGEEAQLDNEEAQRLVSQFIANQEKKRAEAATEEGRKFLEANASKPGVHTTPSGLQYQVLTEAIGRKPTAEDSVQCHYEGRLLDGTVFDSSYRRGEPATFPLSGVIAGWTEGLQLMAEGAKFRFFIPYNLAYGARGAGASIPPYATLIFDVELLKVV